MIFMASFIEVLFFIFFGGAILATAALITRQSLIVAYILLGIIIGPWGLNEVSDTHVTEAIGDVGILFLLFLLGLNLHPQKLFVMLKKVSLVALVSSISFFAMGYWVASSYGYTLHESLVVGAAMMFSSTIIGLKLLPSSVLHHQHTGDLMVGVLLFQDLLAIIVLLLLSAVHTGSVEITDWVLSLLALPGMLLFSFLMERYVLRYLFAKFDRVQEYLFLLAIAWCLSMSFLGEILGLTHEVGAFIAGVAIATSPISLFISERLKPIRDFFLVLFFFAVGASFNLDFFTQNTWLPALLLAILMLVFKPIILRILLKQVSETRQVAWELGIRLGQISEFSLLIAHLSGVYQIIGASAQNLIQAAAIITFIISSYITVMFYPTPVALSDDMRRD